MPGVFGPKYERTELRYKIEQDTFIGPCRVTTMGC